MARLILLAWLLCLLVAPAAAKGPASCDAAGTEAAPDDIADESTYAFEDINLETLPRGRYEVTFTVEHVVEDTIFDELEETSLRVELLHGVTDQLEIGFSVPVIRSELDQKGTARQTLRDSGAGNITLLANVGLPLDPAADFNGLVSLEIGLPTDTRSEDLKSQGTLDLALAIEKFWGPVGVRTEGGLAYEGSEKFTNGNLGATFAIGGLVELSDAWSVDLDYVWDDGQSGLEAEVEVVLSERAAIGVTATSDLEPGVDSRSIGLYLTILLPEE